MQVTPWRVTIRGRWHTLFRVDPVPTIMPIWNNSTPTLVALNDRGSSAPQLFTNKHLHTLPAGSVSDRGTPMTICATEARPSHSRLPWWSAVCGALTAALLLVALAAAPVAWAQDDMAEGAATEGGTAPYTISTTVQEIPAAPDLVIEEGAIRLQLEDAIAIALARNLDIAVERYDREQALYGIEANQGIYDLLTTVDVSTSENDSPTVSQLEGVPVLSEESRDADLTLSQLTPWGGEATFTLGASRAASNSADRQINPSYFGFGNLSFTQPLLRDFGRLPTARGIYLARTDSQISVENFESIVAQIVQQVETAYWNVVESRELFVVAEESLALAQDLDRRNRIQVEVGTLAPIELVQSEATIAERQEQIITAEARLRDADDELLRLLNLSRAMAEGLEVMPLTPPETAPVEIDVEEAIEIALDERPEVRSQRLLLDRLAIDAEYFDNQTLPTLDGRAGYGAQGLGGTGEIPISATEVVQLNTGLGDAFDTVLDRDFTGWNIGLFFSYPLQNRAARAQAAIADLALEQGNTQLSQVELSVITEVRSAARQVRTAEQQIQSAEATSRLQQRNLEAEQKRYENGMSDSFRIAQIQNELVSARSREVTAVTNYRLALADYFRAIGRLLEQKGIALAEEAGERPADERRFRLFDWFD